MTTEPKHSLLIQIGNIITALRAGQVQIALEDAEQLGRYVDGLKTYLSIKEMAKQSHALAKEKGWWDPTTKSGQRGPLEIAALVHSEVSEFVEEARTERFDAPGGRYVGPDGKPEGPVIELADAVIRIGDYCEKMGWDLEAACIEKHAFNRGRAFRHGGKRY
jgi:hypothetical protein